MSDFNVREGTGSNASNVTDAPTLTIEKIRALMDSIPKLPPMPKFDLFGSEHIDKAYELRTDLFPEMQLPGSEGRRMLVVPKRDLMRWYYDLQNAGVDVRLEPRAASAAGERAK